MKTTTKSIRSWVFYVVIMSICLLSHSIGIADMSGKINAQRLWKYMTVENPYQQYPSWPGKEGIYESTMPAGDILRLFLNDLALDTVVNTRGMFPCGSLLIKEIYTDEREVFLITVMYKEKGFNPERNDWYWVKYEPDGSVEMEGKVEVCIECHVGVADNDYVFTGPIN